MANALLDRLERYRDDLEEIAAEASDANRALQKIDRWKDRVARILAENIGPHEVEKFNRSLQLTHTVNSEQKLVHSKLDLAKAYIFELINDVQRYPEDYADSVTGSRADADDIESQTGAEGANTVFIVHGRDEENLLRLEKILKDHFQLDTVILSDQPGASRTLIEKFEQEAEQANYAIVLFTPDDIIRVEDTELFQARPNVLFELGWFFGRLKRNRVVILFKDGTAIPSDLDGINTVRFKDHPKEAIQDLTRELKQAGMI